jgi:hypothetical protein
VVNPTAIAREKIEAALATAVAWREEYVGDGGEDTAYLDGKITALEELLATDGATDAKSQSVTVGP